MSNKILNSPIEKFTRIMFSKVIERLALVMGEKNLSFSQVAALHIIDREHSVPIQEISQRLNLSISATSRLIDDLVKQGLLDRKEDEENRRSKILTLTSEGLEFLNNVSLERTKIFKSTLKSLSKDEQFPVKFNL